MQNAAHSAAIFRVAQSAPFASGGILSAVELGVTQQGTPNMSIVLGPGRAQIVGTSVSPPSGQTWTTQAQYTAYNDANLTLTIATSNPTNPRIDAVYIQVQDSFYSGATNTAVAAVATGTAAVSPTAPAIPANSILLAYVAVAANATTIVNANISYQGTLATLIAVGRSHGEYSYAVSFVNAVLSTMNQTPVLQATQSSSNIAAYLTPTTTGFTVGPAGVYTVVFTANLSAASTGRSFLSIVTVSPSIEYRGGETQIEDIIEVTAEFYVPAGGTISFQIFQTTGAARTIQGRMNISYKPL